MDLRTVILAVTLAAILILFGIGMFGVGFGEERTPVVGMQEAVRIVLTQFPNARISEIELETEDGTNLAGRSTTMDRHGPGSFASVGPARRAGGAV